MTTDTTTDPADMVRCIKTLLRDAKIEIVRHDSACLSQRELAGPLANLMVRDPKGYDALILTEMLLHNTKGPVRPATSAEVAKYKRVTRRTILRWKARALKTLVDEIMKVQ